jgi:hypothetical protein
VGRVRYPLARRLLITADGGGSNGSHVRLWKRELQKLADELGITIEVHHLPPGTSKWNKIEHRLFSFITQNWRVKPLVVAAEEYLSKGGVDDEETQGESLQVETDAELAEDAVCAWNLEDMDFAALTKAFSDLRMRLAA